MENVSVTSDKNVTLEELNYERMLLQLPVVVMLAVILLTGLVGNVIVIYVYINRKASTASFFILLLAFGDLTSCVFCIPFEMFDLINPYKHPVPVACKFFRFLASVAYLWGGLILTSITFERYFKICHPLKIFTVKKAKRLSIVIFITTLCISWPQFFLQGSKTVATRVEGIYGKDCSIRDEMFGSIYALLFQITMCLCYVVGLILFITFYGKIINVVLKRKKQKIGESYSFSKGPDQGRTIDTSESKSAYKMSIAVTSESGSRVQNCDQELDGDNIKVSKAEKNKKFVSPQTRKVKVNNRISSQVQIRIYRTTRIFAVVTTAGVVSYMPYLIAEVLRQIGVAFQAQKMSVAEDLTYEFLVKSYFLNNIVNPIIYSAMIPQFRRDVKGGVKRLFKSFK